MGRGSMIFCLRLRTVTGSLSSVNPVFGRSVFGRSISGDWYLVLVFGYPFGK